MKEQHNKQKIDEEESRGNAGSVESEESQEQASHSFHESLGNPANPGGIPTFPQLRPRGGWKSGKPNQVSYFPTATNPIFLSGK